MTITWLGHSCFLLESGGFRILLDPFHEVPGLHDVCTEADAVYCSHDHFDHAYTDQVTLTAGKENPFTVRETASFHDPEGGRLRGANTIRSFTAEGLTVVHLGDLGHRLSQEQLESIGPCDALLVPVGGTFTVDAGEAKQAADAIGARVVIPMHYRSGEVGFPVTAPVDDFLALYPREKVRRYGGSVLELTADTPEQVAVLSLPEGAAHWYDHKR